MPWGADDALLGGVVLDVVQHRDAVHRLAGVDDFFAWLADRAPYLPPKSPIGRAVRYAQKQETALR